MKSPPTTSGALSCLLQPADDCSTTATSIFSSSTPSLPPLRLPECMKRAVVGCAITLSALQHASLLLSIQLTSPLAPNTNATTINTTFPQLPLALTLLLASTAVSAGTLGFLARTRRVWASLLVFVFHIDALALTLALNYGIASEFFIWLVWVPVLFFLVGAPRCAFAAVCGLFLQGFIVHFIAASASPSVSSRAAPALELTPGTKLVCCGLGLMGVGVVALLLHTPPRRLEARLPQAAIAGAGAAAADPKAELLAHIGHEIKAPLHGILSLAAQVVDSLPQRLWIEKECVRRIVDSGHVMLCIMDNLLDFPAISASQLRLQSTLFSIVDEFNQVLNILKPSAFKKQITLESTIDVRYPQRYGDPKRFRQVLFNVAFNAIKYTPEKGSVCLFLTNSRLSCNRIDVRVEDTGVGIPSELIPHLFELPHLDETTKRSLPGGPGVSLAVSKLLCEAMNGFIDCRSKVGRGSTFSFSVDIPMHEEVTQEHVLTKSADSLSLRRKSEGAEVIVDNKDALLASADRRWARRHSVATTSSSSSGQSPRKRRPNSHSLPKQASNRPRLQRAKSQQLPLADSAPSQTQRHDKTGEAKTRLENRRKSVCQPAPAADLYDNDSGSHLAMPSLVSSADAVPLRAPADQQSGDAVTATANDNEATDDMANARRSGSVIVMSAADKKLKKLQETYQSLQGTRVLLVEDNVVNQKVAKLMLTSLGCEVVIAGNGQIALDLIEQRAPEEAFDVVLMDLQMPVMDGFIASTRIRQRERAENLQRTPIITLTASTTSEYQDRCSACGMDGWLSKPFSKEQLATVISTWKGRFPVTPTPPASPEFSPPSDDGFDAVSQDAAAVAAPAAAAVAQTPHTEASSSSNAKQYSKRPSGAETNNSFKRESPAMAIPTSFSSDQLPTVHHPHADRSNLHRSASA